MANIPDDKAAPIRYTGAGPMDYLWGPYNTLEEACLAIPDTTVDGVKNRDGKYVGLKTENGTVVYWWKKDYSNEGLVEYLGDVKSAIEDLNSNFEKNYSYPFSIVDAANRIAAFIDDAGFFTILKYAEKTVPGSALKDGGVTEVKIDPGLLSAFIRSNNPDYLNISGAVKTTETYPYVIVDASNKILAYIDIDGYFYISKYSLNSIPGNALKNQTIQETSLSSEITNKLPITIPDATGYVYAITDLNDKIVFGIQSDGKVVANMEAISVVDKAITTSKIADGAVTTEKLTDNAITPEKISDKLSKDIFAVRSNYEAITDDFLRANEVEIAASTDGYNGALFSKFPNLKARLAKFFNLTGQTLQVRKSNGLIIPGKVMKGIFSPSTAVVDKVLKGWFHGSGNTSLPSSTGLIAGDYYIFSHSTNAGVVMGGVDTYYRGDLAVWNGTAFVKKPSPVTGGLSYKPGDFWVIDSVGSFNGQSVIPGDHLYILVDQTNGGPRNPIFVKGKPGEYFFRGEFNPATISISDPQNNQILIASSAGTFDGKTFAENDYLIRNNGVWTKGVGHAIVTVSDKDLFSVSCSNLNEYEFRRSDKNSSKVSINLLHQVSTKKIANNENITITGDSMVSTINGTGSSFAGYLNTKFAGTGRTVKGLSYGGGASNEILGMMKFHARTIDTYAGTMHVFWHGRNNASDLAQIKQASYEFIDLIGGLYPRFVFMSVLCTRAMNSFNGSRFISNEAEEAFAGSGIIVDVEKWYQSVFPENWFCTRQALLSAAASSNTPDPQFPGMTEAQVASTYGILPFSYYWDWTSKPFTAAQLVFKGYHSASGLPTGGANFDYFLRTGNGSLGALLVNVSGTWTEYTNDTTHISSVANIDLANAFYSFLTSKNL